MFNAIIWTAEGTVFTLLHNLKTEAGITDYGDITITGIQEDQAGSKTFTSSVKADVEEVGPADDTIEASFADDESSDDAASTSASEYLSAVDLAEDMPTEINNL